MTWQYTQNKRGKYRSNKTWETEIVNLTQEFNE